MVRACKQEDPTRPAVTGIETSCLFYRLFSWTDLAYHDLQFFYRLLSWAKIPTKNIQISVTLLLHFIYKNNYFLPLQAVPDFCVTTLLFSWINGFNLNTHKPQMNATNQCREGDMWKANVELHKPMYAWETMKNRGKFREPKEPWRMPSSQPSPKMSQLFNTCFQDMSNYMIHPWQCIYIYIYHTSSY